MQPAFIIKPNVKKVCLLNVLKVAAAVTIIVAVVAYSRSIFDFSVLTDVMNIGQNELPSTSSLVASFAGAIVLSGLITFALSYMSASRRQYIFYPDRLEMDDNFLIFNLTKKEIPLTNIVSVNPQKKGEKSLVGLGSIVLQLSGTQEKSVELEDLEQPGYYVPYIQKLLENVRQRMQSDYDFNRKVDNTLNNLPSDA